MRVLQAAHRTVHDYPGGAAAVADGLGIGKQVLTNKVNPTSTSHHLSLEEAVHLIKFTGDLQIVHALAGQFDGIFIPKPNGKTQSEIAVIQDISEMSMNFGKLVQEVIEDARDGQITKTELDRIDRDAMKLREALEELLLHVRVIHEQGKDTKKRAPAAAK